VVHRDIKPENIMLDKKGRVKITDFGLAKLLGRNIEAMQLTGARDVMGTPNYMAPEQIEQPQTVDHRADIYSLGVVFYGGPHATAGADKVRKGMSTSAAGERGFRRWRRNLESRARADGGADAMTLLRQSSASVGGRQRLCPGEKLVGAVRFELTTSCTRNTRASQATLRPEPSARESACCVRQMQSLF
jgi:serine/threonine protein kinase